jgi:hypothetical protein
MAIEAWLLCRDSAAGLVLKRFEMFRYDVPEAMASSIFRRDS